MARRNDSDKPIVKDDPSRILPMTMEDVMHNSMIPYAEHVILERALPRVEDGLKPVQRRILYTMLELGTTPDKPHRKCARIVGDCLGKYHPHGDTSVYDALVRMAQPFSMRGPLVDGHGNFGSIDGDSAAAMRYTEARMAPLALQMLRDIEKDTVSFSLNFDDSLKEPDILPARFPNLLVNGATGIAVGLATSIPPHNLGETCRAVIAQIHNPDISLDELMEILPGPDFPTGGILVKNDEIRQGYETGRSKLSVRARVHVEEGASGRKLLVITEVPYQVNKAQMLEKIHHLTEEKKSALSGVYDIRDESDRMGMRAVIELRKDTDVEKTLAYLYKYSDLQVTFGVNIVAIAEGKPQQMSLKAVLQAFIQHQKNVVTRRTQFELKQAQARAHILEGLIVAVDNLDEVIRLIRASKNPKEAREALMASFPLDEVQAQAILDMRLQRLTNLEILALRREYEELQKLIRKLEGILGSEKKLLQVICTELEEVIRTFDDPRRTTIEQVEDVALDPVENQKAVEDVILAFTRAGQLKRMQPAQFRRQGLPAPQDDLRESPLWQWEARTDQTLLIFTDRGNCYPLKVDSLQEVRPKDRGSQLQGMLKDLGNEEKPVSMILMKSGETQNEKDLLMITRGGMIKRTAFSEYDVRSRQFTALNLKEGDSLLSILRPGEEPDLLLISRLGMSIRFPLSDVPVQGRNSRGVIGMQLDEKDEIIASGLPAPAGHVLLFSERGFVLRNMAFSFENQRRGGKGCRCYDFNKNGSNGRYLVDAFLVDEPDTLDFLLVQAKGGISRFSASSVLLRPRAGRAMPCVVALPDDPVEQVLTIPTDVPGEEPVS